MSFNPRDKIISGIVDLQSKMPFFSYLVMNLTLHEDNNIDTCRVSEFGKLYWNSEYIDKLSEKDLYFILCHECLHVAKADFMRLEDRDRNIWNIASDYVINYILVGCDILISNSYNYLFPDAHGNIILKNSSFHINNKTTDEVYDFLINSNDEEFKNQIDDHIYGDGVDIEARKKNAEDWQRKTIEASVIYDKEGGKLPGTLNQFIDTILNPKINWKTALRKYIVNEIPIDYTTRYPSKLFFVTGAWTQSLLRNNLNIMCSIDSSGSTLSIISQFISELYGIIRSYEQIICRVIFWDTEVEPDNDFILTNNSTLHDIKNIKLKNIGGGTELSCYTKYCEKKKYKSPLHVILTDGFIERKPILPQGNIFFVLTKDGDEDIIKKYGKVYRLD
jgi:predicted metal-dependent peptidase